MKASVLRNWIAEQIDRYGDGEIDIRIITGSRKPSVICRITGIGLNQIGRSGGPEAHFSITTHERDLRTQNRRPCNLRAEPQNVLIGGVH